MMATSAAEQAIDAGSAVDAPELDAWLAFLTAAHKTAALAAYVQTASSAPALPLPLRLKLKRSALAYVQRQLDAAPALQPPDQWPEDVLQMYAQMKGACVPVEVQPEPGEPAELARELRGWAFAIELQVADRDPNAALRNVWKLLPAGKAPASELPAGRGHVDSRLATVTAAVALLADPRSAKCVEALQLLDESLGEGAGACRRLLEQVGKDTNRSVLIRARAGALSAALAATGNRAELKPDRLAALEAGLQALAKGDQLPRRLAFVPEFWDEVRAGIVGGDPKGTAPRNGPKK